MPKQKLSKLIVGLQAASAAVSLLESTGVDVDRLVHISNGQGPQSKLIQSTLLLLADQLAQKGTSPDLNIQVEARAALPPKRRKSPKRKPSKTTKVM